MSFKYLYSLLLMGFGLIFTQIPAYCQTENNGASSAKEATPPGVKDDKLDVAQVIFGHVADAHEWHLFTIKHAEGEPTEVALPLPVIVYHPQRGLSIFSSSRLKEGESYEGYYMSEVSMKDGRMKEKIVAEDGASITDLSITKNVLSMFISAILLLLILTRVGKRYTQSSMTAPKGMQNFVEVIIVFLRDEVGRPCFGAKANKFMPLLLTIFFFIWINNLLGLLPGGANFTGNIAVTGCLALVSFIIILANSKKHFWSHLFNPPGVPMGVKPLLVIIEVLSLFIKPAALMIRLFANIIAGHIVILSLICIVFIFAALNQFVGAVFVPVSLAFSIFMFMLELLVGAIQAFIFTNLTAVFISQGLEGAHDEHHHEEAHA